MNWTLKHICRISTRRLAGTWIVAWALLAVSLVVIGLRPTPSSHQSREVVSAGSGIGVYESTLRPLKTRPIEKIRVGDRVAAHNPELSDEQRATMELIKPDMLRKITLRMFKDDGSALDIVLLRPQEWLYEEVAEVGSTIEFELEELGVAGDAIVFAIEPCPTIKTGIGRVVTGTFAHQAAQVIDLQVEGLRDPVGVTANHPFWSETRQAFVAAGNLYIGEQLRSESGLAGVGRITSITPRGPPGAIQQVFNIEVSGEHVYSVSDAGFIVHNACHLNNILSRRTNYGYMIFNTKTGELYKFGISAQALVGGQSKRALRQVSALNAKYGKNTFQAFTFPDKFAGRRAALKWEQEMVGLFRKNLGHPLPGNLRPGGQIWPW